MVSKGSHFPNLSVNKCVGACEEAPPRLIAIYRRGIQLLLSEKSFFL